MTTVEQCETQLSGMSNISKSLYDDTFKPSQEEEKDSDEESFHLPFLDCDDDQDSNIKEALTSDVEKVQNGETEDDILNKFETNCTPDIDPKMEDSILDEIDNLLEKKLDKRPVSDNMDGNCKSKNISVKIQEELSSEKKNDASSSDLKTLEIKDHNNEITLDELGPKINTKINSDKENKENIKNITENVNEGAKKAVVEKIEQKDVKGNNQMNLDPELVNEKINSDKDNDTKSSESNIIVEKAFNVETSVKKIKKVKASSEINQSDDLKNMKNETSNSNNNLQTEEIMEVDNKEKEEVTSENNSEGVIPNEMSKGDISCEEANQSAFSKTKNTDGDQNIANKAIEKQLLESPSESMELGDGAAVDDINSQSSNGPDKCENSNDSSKSQNLECEDLLDISIIRDADEDNASAIAENASDTHTSEKSDNDDQDEGSDKAENELDENDMDQDETLLANDKDDNMDFEDGGSNLCDQENAMNGNISDSENKTNAEIRDSEDDSKDSASVLKQKSDRCDIEISSEKNRTGEDNFDLKDNRDTEETEESLNENSTKGSSKRSLSETDIIQSPNKKLKLSERSKTEEKIPLHKNKIKTLVNFEKYMQNKKLEHKLTRSDLEQFCLQKICEAIVHKTDVGELHQTIKKQEQIIENLRKDLQQLTKQTRDLDIVNKKLMNELRTQNGTKKPLVPLKITRSVGLQVKLNCSTETINRRKVPAPTTPRTPNNSTPARPRTVAPANAAVVRQVAASPRKTTNSAPLLSQALQSRSVTPAANVTKRTPIRPKVADPQKPAKSSVIDLTDEDDKASKGVVGRFLNKTVALSQGKTINIIPAKTLPNKIVNSNQNKTVTVSQVKASINAKVGTPTRTVAALPQGVRLTPTQVKNGSIAIPASVVTSNSGTTQFMYVVQPGSVVTSTAGGTQKAVLLNFQPTNGVLTSTLNGSAVSVLPSKASSTVQLKTVTTPRKHPAPLPSPPSVTVNASLKPLLPKPHLSIRKTDTGIILQWRMPYNLDFYEAIASYQLFAYQETNAPPNTEMWRKVGDVKALALPMACTLTQFADKNKYYFAVRSIDVHKRIGAFSDPEEISL